MPSPRARIPARARVKTKATDDARLLTNAPRDRYLETDIPGILTFHAPGANAPEAELGRIISVNKGSKGGGFAWCAYCEHAEPVPNNGIGWQQDYQMGVHRNPRSDEPCDFHDIVRPVDLGHVFETDVRTFMIITAPSVAAGAMTIVDDRLRKTLREAFRLAVARLLETDARDLRATDQRIGGMPIIVLYDAVAGGAGYTTRLTSDPKFPMRKILEGVRNVLDCKNIHCMSSCTHCLNDYSNQKNWQDFDRRPALEWVVQLLCAKPLSDEERH